MKILIIKIRHCHGVHKLICFPIITIVIGSYDKKSTHSLIQYLSFMQIDNPININKRYEHIQKINTAQFVGKGLFKTHAYDCIITENQYRQKINQFWETRTAGDKQAWKDIKKAIESRDNEVAQQILNQGKLRALNHSLQMCVDARKRKYDIPIYCINPPVTYSAKSAAQAGLVSSFFIDQIEVIIRCTKFTQDINFTITNDLTGLQLKELFRDAKGISETAKIRFFSYGKELQDSIEIGSYQLKDKDVIQAMVADVNNKL